VKLFNRPEVKTHYWDKQEAYLLATASRRVHSTSSEQMLAWADGAASEMMRALEDYMKHEQLGPLIELADCVITLQAVVKELYDRHLLTHEQ
jgi:hypothetical protein